MYVLPPEERIDINKSLDNIELFDSTKKKSTADFYNSLPPDAKFQFFQDGTSGFVDSRGNKYTPPPSIDDRGRSISSNTDIIEYNRLNTLSSGNPSNNVAQGNETIDSSTTGESGSDFLTNVGGAGATTFDYDLSEADLLEAVELRKAAYGEDVQIQTSSTTNAAGEEEKTFLERTGDRLYEIFVSGPASVETRSSPVSGKTVATKVPGVGGVMDAATMFSPVPGLGTLANKMGDRLVDAQEADTRAAVVGMTGYGAVQVQEKSTGRIIDLTTSPAFGKGLGQSENRTAFMNALGITDNTSVGTYAESDVQGPVIFNGIEYPNINAVIAVVSRQGYVSPFAMEANIPAGEDYDRNRVVGAGEKRIGLYDEDSGEINLGFGRTGAVTGVALDGSGNLNYKTDGSGFVMGMGEMVNTGTGIGYSGSRANIAGANNLTASEAQDLLNKINSGEITSTPNTTEFLQNLGNPFSNIMGDDFIITEPPFVANPIFGTVEPLSPVTVEKLPTGDDFINQMEDQVDADTYQMQEATLPSTIQQYNINTGDDNNNDDDGADPSSMGDSGFGGGGGFATAMGGRIGKQEGGVANQQGVSQIVQGAGFIAPQGNATEQQTIADDIPLEAEEGDFIINAPAAQFAGRQDIVTMITEAIESLREKGVDIQYGNPTIPVEKSVKLAVSRNEVYIPKAIAEEIGYDKLQKINKRGQKEVQRRQEEAQSQVARGGFVAKAKGDVVTNDETLKEDKSSMMGSDEGSFIQDIGRAVYQSIRDNVAGFLSPKETEKQELKESDMPKSRPTDLKTSKVVTSKEKPFAVTDQYKPQDEFQKITYDALDAIEKPPKGFTKRKGYVPRYQSGKPFEKSGVTIGLGIDLGQFSPLEFKNMGLSKELYAAIQPYTLNGHLLDNRDGRATNAQQVRGLGATKLPELNLTDEQVSELNFKVYKFKKDKFDKIHGKDYKNFNNPEDKVSAFAMDWGGAFKNPVTFKRILNQKANTEDALIEGYINNPNISSVGLEASRAKRLLGWYKNYKDKNRTSPPEVKMRPPQQSSFLSPTMG